jgi:hypothetical protein
MGCSCRTFRKEPLARPCVSEVEPSFNDVRRIALEGSRDPAFEPRSARAGFSFWRIHMQRREGTIR